MTRASMQNLLTIGILTSTLLTTLSAQANDLGAPLCNTLVTEQEPNALFTGPLIPADSILHAYYFGEMQPTDLQEVLNWELGFYIKNEPQYANVPITAPANLYIQTLEITKHDANFTDYSISYEVCSHVKDNVKQPAVVGNYAHIKALAPDLQAILDFERFRIEEGLISPQDSPLQCPDGLDGSCTYFVSMKQYEDPNYQLIVSQGQPLGTTSSPGIDANLMDYRRQNYFINPARYGSEIGHSAGFRYAVCTYEYFVEPYRTDYLATVGANGVFRNSQPVDDPCGIFEVDKGSDGTAAGLWISSDKVQLEMYDDMPISEFEELMSNVIVLSEDPLKPLTHLTMSSALLELTGFQGQANRLEFETNMPQGAYTNVPFKDVIPGIMYCYEGHGYLSEAIKFNFLLQLSDDSSIPVLTVDRLKEGQKCSDTKPSNRKFGDRRIKFFR